LLQELSGGGIVAFGGAFLGIEEATIGPEIARRYRRLGFGRSHSRPSSPGVRYGTAARL
jgi:hypothetical protein